MDLTLFTDMALTAMCSIRHGPAGPGLASFFKEIELKRELTPAQLIERSIIKKYRKQLWAPFMTAVTRYELIEPGDKIAVCVSGGKDSFLLAKLMQELHKHTKVPFEVIFLVMDPGYAQANREMIEKNAALMEIPITIFESGIFDVTYNTDRTPCYLCAKMRRGYLYDQAKKLGCNKIALGHHMSDVIETTVMAMFNSSKLEAMMPKLHSLNFEGMELIRPLYCILEEDILDWVRYNDLHFLQCACRYTETGYIASGRSQRQETKNLIRELKKNNPLIEQSIFNAIHSVRIETFPGYKLNGEMHTFLDWYDDKDEEGRIRL